jgi:hypothetical protein
MIRTESGVNRVLGGLELRRGRQRGASFVKLYSLLVIHRTAKLKQHVAVRSCHRQHVCCISGMPFVAQVSYGPLPGIHHLREHWHATQS